MQFRIKIETVSLVSIKTINKCFWECRSDIIFSLYLACLSVIHIGFLFQFFFQNCTHFYSSIGVEKYVVFSLFLHIDAIVFVFMLEIP